MSVFYKFKNTLEFDIVTFDGLHISVADLKTSIMQQKKMGKSSDFDLQITNDQTKEVYENDELFIPKNTSVIVARIPVTAERAAVSSKSKNLRKPQELHFPADLSSDLVNSNASEEDKVKAMISQSSQEYDPSMYLKVRNMTGPIPPNYTCFKCGQKGHWINNCLNGNIKRSKGIPRSFMVPVDGPDHKGALLTSSGEYAVPLIDHVAYREVKKEKSSFGNVVKPELEPEVQIPEDLLCLLCRDLLHDAVLTPCCGNSFCDECLREALLNSDNHECPLCHEDGVSPDSIIPNRFLRTAVLTFTNETGHTKVRQITSIRFLQSSDVDSAQSSADSVAHNPAVPSKPVVKEAVPAEDGTAIPSTTVLAFENVDLEQSVAVESIQHLADPLVQDKTERKDLDCNETMESMQNRRVRGEIDKNVENERDETLQCTRQFSCPSVQDKAQESIEFRCTQTLESTQLYPDPSVQGESAENVDPECNETLEFFQQPPVTRLQEETVENVNISRSIDDRMHKVAKVPQTRSSRDRRARTRNTSCSPSRTRTSSRPTSFRTSRSLSGTVSHSSVPRSHSTHSLTRSRSRSKARSYSRSRSRSYSRSRSRSYSRSRSRSYSRSRSRRRSFSRDRVRHQRDVDTPARKTIPSRYHRPPLRVKHSYISSYEHSYFPQYGAPSLLPPAFVPPPTVLPPGVMVPHASQEMYGVQPTTYFAPVGYYNASEHYPHWSSVSGHDYDNQYHGYNSYHKSAFSQMYEPGKEGGFNEPPLQEKPMHGEGTPFRIPVLIGNRGRGGKYAYQQKRDPWEHEKIYTADVQRHQMGYFPSDIQRNEKAIVHNPVSRQSCKPTKRVSSSYEKSADRKPFTGVHDDLQRGAEVSRSDGTDRFRNLSVSIHKDKRRVRETEKSENRPSLKEKHSSSKRLKLHRSREEFASSNISHDTQRAMEYEAIDTKCSSKHDWQKSFRDGEIKDPMCVAYKTLVSKRTNEHRRQFCKERNDHCVQEYSNSDYSYPDDFNRKKYENSNRFHKGVSKETKFYDSHAPRDHDNRRKQGCGIQSNQIADVRARNTERRDVEHLNIIQSRSISNDSGDNYSSVRKQVVKKHHRSKCSARSYEHRFKKRNTSQVSVNESVKTNMQSRIDDSKVSYDAVSKSCHGANTVKSQSREKRINKGSKRSCSTATDTHSKRMKQDTHTASTSLNLSESGRRKLRNASHEEKEAASITQNSCRKDDDRNSSISEGAKKVSKGESPERKHKHKKKQKKHKKHKHQKQKSHKKK